MKRKSSLFIVISIIAALTIFRFLQNVAFGPYGYGAEPYVARVIDGDTVELSTGEKVRYIGIDTPEVRQREGSEWIYKPRPYSEEAKEFNRSLVEGKKVRLEFDVQKKDKYRRLLAYVYVNGKMANLEMVRNGYAMIYTYPPNVKYAEDFLSAQKKAREEGKGLWEGLEEKIIFPSQAKENIGLIRIVETEVLDTYLSERVLILNCPEKFKIVIFRNNLALFPKAVSRSPDSYFRYKTIRVWGVIKKYKGAFEIIVNDPSQMQVLNKDKPAAQPL